MVNFKEKSIISQGSRVFQHFPGGGGPTFSRGSNRLFPIETPITCDFPGGSGPPVPPPSGSALARINVLAQGHNAVTPVRLEPAGSSQAPYH